MDESLFQNHSLAGLGRSGNDLVAGGHQIASQRHARPQPIGNQMERLLGDRFACAGNKQPQTNTPTQSDQMAMVAQRREWQFARNRLRADETALPQLILIEAMKMVHMKIFVPFAFGVPKDRDLKSLELLQRHTANSPARR